MKKFILLIPFVVVALASMPSRGQDGVSVGSSHLEIQNAVILPFCMALKNGAVGEFRKYLSNNLYNEYKSLLEENTEYPEFLRSYYKGANIHVLKAFERDGEIEFNVLIEFSGGTQSISALRVSEETNGDEATESKNRWKISSIESIR
jgi:hypothetical protein